MAKKLAPLVIPTVLDTSGISRGVSNIRNRLRGVGGAGGTATGGSGFSSGVVPYGMGDGNGSGASAAMAAAFGASAGSRVSTFASGRFGFGKETSRFGTRARARMAAKGREQGLGYRTYQELVFMRMAGNDFKEAYQDRTEIGKAVRWEYQDNYEKAQAKYYKTLERQKQLQRSVKRGMQWNPDIALNRAIKGIGGGLGAVGGIGSIYAGASFLNQFTPNAMYDRFQDVSNLRGQQREMAYAMKTRLMRQGKEATLAQRFFMGTQAMMGPDQPSAVERNAGNLYAGAGKVAERAGVVFEHLIFAATDPQRYGMWWAAYLDSDKRGN